MLTRNTPLQWHTNFRFRLDLFILIYSHPRSHLDRRLASSLDLISFMLILIGKTPYCAYFTEFQE
jgi:hypothetical protein